MVLKITQTDQQLLMELHLSLTLNVTAVTLLLLHFYEQNVYKNISLEIFKEQ